MNQLSDRSLQLLNLLREIKPTSVLCSAEIKLWWHKDAMPVLKDTALSQLRRTNEFRPTLIGFTQEGPLGVIDVAKAVGGDWGDVRSKDATAAVHRISAMVPGTKAVVFACEAWALRGKGKEAFDRQRDEYPNLGDHPDSFETVMLNMLHYDDEHNHMMQLLTMVEVIKVLGKNTSPRAWRDTKFGEESTTDPADPKTGVQKGRFVAGDPDNAEP